MPDDSMPEMAILSSPEQGGAKSTLTDEVFPDHVKYFHLKAEFIEISSFY